MRRLPPAHVLVSLLAGLCVAAPSSARATQARLGGCETTEAEYGLAALADSVALGAVDELLSPGEGPKTGPHCKRLKADAALFLKIGAVQQGVPEHWALLARQVTECLEEFDLHLAERSLLRHTTGTCFPPYHVDFRLVGAAGAVEELLDQLSTLEWEGFVQVQDRWSRTHFLSAGRSLQLTGVVVDLQATE